MYKQHLNAMKVVFKCCFFLCVFCAIFAQIVLRPPGGDFTLVVLRFGYK